MLTLESGYVYALAAVQIAGLASACLMRIGERSARQASYQWLFLACLVLVGATTLVAMLVGPGTCMLSGTTLAVMVLTATWDFGGVVF